MNRKMVWVFSLLLVAAVTYMFLSGVEKEMCRIEIIPDEEVFQPLTTAGLNAGPESWSFDSSQEFFMEYRLERERIRSQETEMLNEMINNPQVGSEARLEAEQQLLQLVNLMEKELLAENLLKAQGYKDALLFSCRKGTIVMVETEKLEAEDFLRVTETVAATIEIPREEVQVIQHK
ncbi:MAG: SpoIIIAH-like family protein [Dethiobacteria bacterium]|jgi:stage III sporulation protein AH